MTRSPMPPARTSSIAALLAAALFSAVVVIPFLTIAHDGASGFAIEAWMTSTRQGHVQVYHDENNLFREDESATATLGRSAVPEPYRLDLPCGKFSALRFDPIDRDGTVTIERVRIVDDRGNTVRSVPLEAFSAAHQIGSLRREAGRLVVETEAHADDPQLIIQFDTPLELRITPAGIAADWALRALVVFAALILLYGVARALRLPPDPAAWVRALAAHPRRGLALVSAVAAIASAYPVVFLGRSYVSPNLGTTLLYGSYPTLPGYADDRKLDVHGSDVGSTLWGFVPYAAGQHRALLRDHEIPLWNRWNSAGTPLLAQGYSMFGDPLHFLPVLANSAAWAWDLRYLIAKALLAFGAGLLVLAATKHAHSAAIISLAAPFAGFFVYRINHPAFFSFCYAPWPLLCWIGLAQAGRPRSAIAWCAGLLAANFALMNTGTVKEAYMMILSLNFSGACVLLSAAESRRVRIAKFAGAAATGALFLLVSAPITFPFLDALRTAYTGYNAPSAYQIQPGVMLGAFDEAFYRPLGAGRIVFNPAANFLILAGLLYFLATLRSHSGNRAVVAIAASSLLPLSMAFGLVPPSWIIRTPFLANVAHIDNSFSCALIVLWMVMAGAGFAVAARRLATPEGRGDLLVAGLLLFGLVFAYVAFGQAVHRAVFGPGTSFSLYKPGESLPVDRFVWGYLASLLVALAGLGLLARRAMLRGRPSALVLAGLAICGYAMLWRQGVQPAAAGFEAYTARLGGRVDFHARSGAIGLVQDSQKEGPSRTVGIHDVFSAGWTGIYALEGLSGPDPLMNRYYRELTLASPVPRLWDWRLYVASDGVAAERPFLDFLNVRHYLDLGSDPALLGASLRLVRAGDLDVYESRSVWPRAFFTDRLAVYGSAVQLMDRILHGDGRPFAAIQETELPSYRDFAALSRDLAGRTVAPATGYRLTENTTSFTINAPDPGVAVLTEAWWPGYPHATLDGRKVPVIRINHAFEGILIGTPGLHAVSVSYRPRHFLLLEEGSAAGILIVGLILGVALTRRKP